MKPVNQVSNAYRYYSVTQKTSEKNGKNSETVTNISYAEVSLIHSSKVPQEKINKIITERILSGVKLQTDPKKMYAQASSGNEELFQTGRSSPEDVAQNIFDGITGYIYEAYKSQHPDMTEEDFTKFMENVVKGVQKGISEARSILNGLGALNEEMSDWVNQIETNLYDKLGKFMNEEIEKFRSN